MTTVLGKSASTLSEILSLNKLPAEVKDDCRNDPKAGRSILVLIAQALVAEVVLQAYADDAFHVAVAAFHGVDYLAT